jgi:hypothetical protein
MVSVLYMKRKPKRSRVSADKRLWQVIINKNIHRQFKARCAEDGLTMNDKLGELIQEWLKNKKKAG